MQGLVGCAVGVCYPQSNARTSNGSHKYVGVRRVNRSDVPVEHTTPASGRTAGEARVAAGTPLRRQKMVASSRVMVMKMERSGLLGKRLGS